MKPKVSTHSDLVRETSAGIQKRKDAGGGDLCEGHTSTKYGFVIVCSHSKPSPSTTLVFIWGELFHYRYIDAFYNPERLAAIARDFAKDIATLSLKLFE